MLAGAFFELANALATRAAMIILSLAEASAHLAACAALRSPRALAADARRLAHAAACRAIRPVLARHRIRKDARSAAAEVRDAARTALAAFARSAVARRSAAAWTRT